MDRAGKERFDLIILDLMLPEVDGFQICKELRERLDIPILMVSAKGEGIDKIRGLGLGADDYITKPFTLDLLIVKINAMLRRTYSYKDSNLSILEHKGVILDIEKNKEMVKDDSIRLTYNESKILAIFMRNPDRVIPRYKFMKALWDDENFVDDNTLTVNITRLRSKLKSIGVENYIATVKGEGYRLYEDV